MIFDTSNSSNTGEKGAFTAVFYETPQRPSGDWCRLSELPKWLCKPGSEFKQTKAYELRNAGLVKEVIIDGMPMVDVPATKELILASNEPAFFKRRLKK